MIDALSLFGSSGVSGTAGKPKPAFSPPGTQTVDGAERPPNVAAVERIKEIGFARWAEELRDEKIEEMREEILAAMGLSEAKLAAMDPDARATVEQSIQQRISERLAASSLTGESKSVGAQQSGVSPQPVQAGTGGNTPAAAGFATGGAQGTGVALGPAAMTVLLNAQESESRSSGLAERIAARR